MSLQEINQKNPIYIREINLKNYRTFQDLKIELTQNIHTLVGPNECGKTNLLLAFELLTNPLIMQKTDTCYYSDNFIETEPEIKFKIDINNFKIPLIEKSKIKEILICCKGNNRTFDFKCDEEKKILIFTITLKSKAQTGQVHISLPELQKYLNLPSAHIEQNKLYSFNTSSIEEVDKIRNYIECHPQKANIEFDIKDNISNTPISLTINEILKNFKVINWDFDKQYYIPNLIPLSELQANPNKYATILNFFKIANQKIEIFIKTTDHNLRENILRHINDRISKILNQCWTQYQDIRLNLSLGTDNTLHISFLENDRIIDPNKRSLGFQWFVAFLLHFNANFGNELKNCLILLDEPGIHLHPGGQNDLLKEIEKLAIWNQIIYTTHLPFMVNRNHPERIIFLNKIRGITTLTKPKKGLLDNILLGNTLGFSFSSISNFGEVNLFVEGITDKILIEALAVNYSQKLNSDLLDLNNFSIISINGISNLDSFIRVAQESKINYLVLIDGDKKGEDQYKKYKENSKKYNNAIEVLHKLPKDKEIEDLIPFDIINNAFNDLLMQFEPWNILISKEKKLNNEKINPQLKKIIKEIEELFKTSQDKFETINKDDVDLGKLKLDLMLCVKNIITEKNCMDFKILIDILKKINDQGMKIIKKLREQIIS